MISINAKISEMSEQEIAQTEAKYTEAELIKAITSFQKEMDNTSSKKCPSIIHDDQFDENAEIKNYLGNQKHLNTANLEKVILFVNMGILNKQNE